jgi:DNA-binding transcriptional LysR family regulator
VSESIAISLKRAAIILADELDYAQAAEKLNITRRELREQVSTLEMHLCLRISKSRQRRVELTGDGRFLIKAFREAIAVHDRNVSKDAGEANG